MKYDGKSEVSKYGGTVVATKPRRLTLKCRNPPLMGAGTKMDVSILFPVKSSYIFW